MQNIIKINSNNISKINGNGKNQKLNPVLNFKKVETPIISVIVPVLQEEKILNTTLSRFSVQLRNKYKIELIVSDGGSTDKTIQVAEEYADIVVKHSKPIRQTIAEGRNLGAEKASGDILVFINGDTIPENIEYFFELIFNWSIGNGKYNKYSALACKVSVPQDEIIFKDKIFYCLHNYYVRFLNALGLGMGRGECQIVRTDIFRKVNGYNPKLVAGEDFDLYRRIAKVSRVGFAKELQVFESPRRFRKYGYLKILYLWTINALSVIIRGKSISNKWDAVR